MVKKIEELNVNNDLDIVYFYKNAHEYSDDKFTEWLSQVSFSDISICIIAFNHIESKIMEELRESKEDIEMVYMMKLCNRESNKMVVEANQAKEKDLKKDINNGGLEKNDSRWYLNHLNILLRPFIGIYNKQIVDLTFFVYKKTGFNYFDLLFNAFKSKNDLLIELHLLVARGLKQKSFDFSDIKRSLEEAEVHMKKGELDFFAENITDDETSKEESLEEKEFTDIIEVGAYVKNKPINFDNKPFLHTKKNTTLFHLNEARQLLSEVPIKNQLFFLENVTTFLSMKFDKELFLDFIKLPKDRNFFKMLNKFENIPFFFYKDIDIKKMLLIENNRLFEAKKAKIKESNTLAKKVAELLDNNFTDEDSTEQDVKLYKHDLVCNPYTLKYFLEFCISSFNSKSICQENFVLISSALFHFVKKYQSLVFFIILEKLLKLRNITIENEIKENILIDLDVYLEIFNKYKDSKYDSYKGSEQDSYDIDPKNPKDDNNKCNNSNENNDTFIESICDEWQLVFSDDHIPVDKTASNTKFPIIPSLADKSDQIIRSFISPYMHKEIEEKLSQYLIKSFLLLYGKSVYESSKASFESFLLEASSNHHFKIFFINNLSRLKNISNFNKICKNLQNIDQATWRYKALLILNHKPLIEAGIPLEWFKNTMGNDKIFFVRKLVETIPNN